MQPAAESLGSQRPAWRGTALELNHFPRSLLQADPVRKFALALSFFLRCTWTVPAGRISLRNILQAGATAVRARAEAVCRMWWTSRRPCGRRASASRAASTPRCGWVWSLSTASSRSRAHPAGAAGAEQALAPFEFKTGRPHMSHGAQVCCRARRPSARMLSARAKNAHGTKQLHHRSGPAVLTRPDSRIIALLFAGVLKKCTISSTMGCKKADAKVSW